MPLRDAHHVQLYFLKPVLNLSQSTLKLTEPILDRGEAVMKPVHLDFDTREPMFQPANRRAHFNDLKTSLELPD